MLKKAYLYSSNGNVSELEFEKLLRRAEEKSKAVRPVLLKKTAIHKHAANS